MSIEQIHVTNSTKMSLNDRFTIMQTLIGPNQANNSNNKNIGNTKIISRNDQLLNQLDKKHNMIAALKIKRRNIKRGLKQQMNNMNKIKRTLKSGNLVVTPTRNLRRRNSTTNLNMNNQVQQNNRQSRSRSRSRSRTNVNRSRSNSKQQRANTRNKGNFNTNSGQKLNRNNFRKRSNSVNSRLGNNAVKTRGVARGRVVRRTNPPPVKTIQQRIGNVKPLNRNNIARNRSRSRNRAQQQQAQPQQQQQRQLRQRSASRNRRMNTTNQRGRGGARGRQPRARGRSQNRSATPKNNKSKEQLDQELDQYMSNTKTELDHEMEEYINSTQT